MSFIPMTIGGGEINSAKLLDSMNLPASTSVSKRTLANKFYLFVVTKKNNSTTMGTAAFYLNKGRLTNLIAQSDIRIATQVEGTLVLISNQSAYNADLEVYEIKGSGSGEDTSSIDLLWTNSAPSSSFAAQDVSLNLSSYDYLMIVSKRNITTTMEDKTSDAIQRTFFKMSNNTGVTNRTITCSSNLSSVLYRNVTLATDKVTFGAGYNAGSQANNSVVPIYIYGIKTDAVIN